MVVAPVAKSPMPAAPDAGLAGGEKSIRVADRLTVPLGVLASPRLPDGAAPAADAAHTPAAMPMQRISDRICDERFKLSSFGKRRRDSNFVRSVRDRFFEVDAESGVRIAHCFIRRVPPDIRNLRGSSDRCTKNQGIGWSRISR